MKLMSMFLAISNTCRTFYPTQCCKIFRAQVKVKARVNGTEGVAWCVVFALLTVDVGMTPGTLYVPKCNSLSNLIFNWYKSAYK